jgi:mannose-6-phosphate isomerase-like protein (cupin superfamily)
MTSGATANTAQVLGTNDGRTFRLGPIEIIVKEDGTGTRGKIAVAEFRGNRFRIPPHTHTEHDENIYVLQGTLSVMLGGQTHAVPAGSSFTIPVDVPHSIANDSDEQVRFLNIIAPARYLAYFDEMAAAAGDKLPEPAVMFKVMAKYGLQPVK